jgi:hypothetical protein
MRNESRTRMNDGDGIRKDRRVGYKLKHKRRGQTNQHRESEWKERQSPGIH